jgi:hypothetical protein
VPHLLGHKAHMQSHRRQGYGLKIRGAAHGSLPLGYSVGWFPNDRKMTANWGLNCINKKVVGVGQQQVCGLWCAVAKAIRSDRLTLAARCAGLGTQCDVCHMLCSQAVNQNILLSYAARLLIAHFRHANHAIGVQNLAKGWPQHVRLISQSWGIL